MVQIHPKLQHFTPQMHEFYVFNTPCNVSLSCRFTSQQFHEHVLNAAVFNTSCNVPLSRRLVANTR